MSDRNICEHCDHYLPIGDFICPLCLQPIILDSTGAVSIWRLGNVRDGILGPVAQTINTVFGVPVIVQPAYIDERLAQREGWKGISSIVFLNQVLRRHQKNMVACLGIFCHHSRISARAKPSPNVLHDSFFGTGKDFLAGSEDQLLKLERRAHEKK